MASESVTNCLLDAIKVVRSSTALDREGREAVVERLQQVLESRELPDRVVVEKMAYAMKDARQIAFINYVASVADEAANGRLAAIPNGERSYQRVSPRMGNRGDPEDTSLEVEINAETRRTNGRLKQVYDTVTETRVWKGIRDSELGQDFVRAAHGATDAGQKARGAAKLYQEVMGEYLDRPRRAGVWVEDMQNYFPQSHHFARISADFDNWKQFLVDNLDKRYHTDREATAQRIYDSLTKEDADEGPSQALITMARKVHFKDADAAAEYFFRYGKDNVSNTVLRSVENIVTKTLMAEKFGPRAKQNYEKLVNRVREQNNKQKERLSPSSREWRQLDRDTRFAEKGLKTIEFITGDLSKPANQDIANWSGAIRNYLSFVYLGKVAASFVAQDTQTAMFSARFQTDGFMSGAMGQARALFDVLSNSEARAVVDELGLFPHVLAANAMQRMGTQQDLNFGAVATSRSERALGRSMQLSTFTQRATGAQWLEHSHRAAFGLLTSRAMNRQRRYAWNDLTPRYREVVLRRNGITEDEWEGLRKQAVTRYGTGAIDTTKLPPLLRKKVENALIREAEVAVTFPSASDRMLLNFNLNGTWPGEFANGFTQFLSWPVGFFRNAVMREYQNGGSGMVGFAGAMIAAGILQQQLYAMIDGRPLYAPDSPELWMRGIGRSGLFTPIGESMLAGLSGDSRGLITNPMIDTFGTGLRSLSAASLQGLEGEWDEAAATAARQVERVAVPNWWQTSALINRGMYHAMEELDPEYNKNVERRMDRQKQTVKWWELE